MNFQLFQDKKFAKTVFLPLNCFGIFLKNQLTICKWIYLWISYFVPYIYIDYLHSLFVYPYLFDYSGIIVGLIACHSNCSKIQNIFGY